MAPRSQKAAALKVSPIEVLAAIESLYADQVRPQGRILLKRLGERAAAARAGQVALGSIPGLAVGSEVVPRLDTAHIRKVCERCPRIQVVAEAGTEYSALLVGRTPSFIDPCSNDDPFPERLWSEMAAFFGSYQNRGVRLPGGRYACARALAATHLPFLAGRSLGEVCHIVQLAVSQRQVLGYLDGHVVPYFQSEAVVKQHSAVLQQPAWSLKKDTMAVADLAQARECLRAILAGSGEAGVPLPNVKRLFRSRFQLELSETALGHCRISDLLQDERFLDICTLQPRGNTYVVVLSQGSVSEVGADFASPDEEIDEEACSVSDHTPTKHEEEQHSFWQSFAARTFIHLKSSPATPVRRSSSVPKDHGFGQNLDLSPSDSVSTEATESDSPTPRRLRFCPDEPLSLDEASSAESGSSSLGFPLMTPSPQYEMPCYGARRSVATESEGRAAVSNAVAGGAAQPDAPPRRVQFCPDEPLSLQEALPSDSEMMFNFAVVTPSPQYEHPRRSWMPAACSARSAPEMVQASVEACDAISLFRSLGLEEISRVEAIAEVSESDSDSESERTPMCAEPLSLDDDTSIESEVPLGFPLMTPSPAYHAAASARYASLRSGQQFPHPPLQADFLAGAQFDNFPCALRQHGLSFGHQPRLAAVGGA